MDAFVVAAFYQFAPVTDRETLRRELYAIAWHYDLCGTILLAPEGINSTSAGSREGMDVLLSYLRARFPGLEHKESYVEGRPFGTFKVKLKPEIVTMGVPGTDPLQLVGTYVDPADWNALITDPETLLIDTRNDYEYAEGTFKGAIDPKTASFREFPDYIRQNLDPAKHRKIATFCTGGIRCEKATSYLRSLGFDEVYHLRGGILKYLEEVDPEESLWQGSCYVFDERRAVDHGLQPTPLQHEEN